MSRVKFVTESRGNLKEVPQLLSSPLPSNVCIVITILHYLKPIARTIKQSEPLDNVGTDNERSSFMALKNILTVLESGKNEPINIYPFLEKFCHIANTNLHEFEHLDVSFVWDSVIKLVTLVIPPIREIFMGKILNSYDITNWLNSISRCFHAQFVYPVQNLEEIIDSALIGNEVIDDDEEDKLNDEEDTLKSPATFKKVPRIDKIRRVNAKLIHRAPEVLVFSIESPHLPSALRFTDSSHKSKSSKAPVAIRFPASFDVSTIINSSIERRAMLSMHSGIPQEYRRMQAPCLYDLSAVVSLEGIAYDSMRAFYRCLELEDSKQWFEGSTPHHEEVETCKAVDGNFLISSDSRRIHPRLLVYTKRDMFSVLERLGPRVSKAGQMKDLGDTMYDTAETPEHYDDARHYYEQAIVYDESLRASLHDRMAALENIERNQRAQCYESQADISLGKRRFKEACDLYKNALRSVAANSPAHHRLREKEDYMMKIISLEISNHLTEKGQECLKSKAYVQGKEHFSQALKLNPTYIHLQTIIAGIDEAITIQSSAQKVSDANQAMKVGKYKQANQLYLEAIALVPSRQDSLKPVLESLVVLMQGEEALSKQRAGLVALEDKKYSLAIECITEAIELLPAESATENAFFLCDRAQVYFELKEFHTSIKDCNSALELRSDFAIAYLRLGAAQFELEQYDEATMSYERALRHDASLTDQVKVKVRQVNTAKEVLQRKEREAERLRDKEEQKRLLEERRAKEEAAKKSREQKLQQEKAEKAERMRMAEEEKKTRAALIVLLKESCDEVDDKVAAKERLKKAKAENNVQKAQEREKAKLEKERERERLKVERERKIQSEQKLKEDEIKKQREFAAEIERAQMRHKEAEREKELERERARIERERVIAERERVRVEKITSSSSLSEGGAKKVKVPVVSKSTDSDPIPSKVKVTVAAAGPSPIMSSSSSSSSSAVEALPAPTGVKWSSFLTQQPPPPPPPPPSTASPFQHSNKQQPIATSSSAAAVAGSGIKEASSVVPDSMQDFPPLGEMTTSLDHRDLSSSSASASSGKNYQNDAGYQQYVSSSAWGWADHERAMLEATAERISVNKSANEPSVATVMSSSSTGDSLPSSSSSPSSSIQSPPLPTKSSASFFDLTKDSRPTDLPPGIDPTTTTTATAIPSSSNKPRDPESSSEISPLMAKLGLGSSSSSSSSSGRGNYVSSTTYNNNNGEEQVSNNSNNGSTNNNYFQSSTPSLDAAEDNNYDINLLLLSSSLNSNPPARKANQSSSFNSFNLDALTTTTPLGDLASSSHLNQLDLSLSSSGSSSSLNKDFGVSYGLSSDKSLALSGSSSSSSHLSALLGSIQSSTKKDSQTTAASIGLSYGTAAALSTSSLSSSSLLFPSSSSMAAGLNGKEHIFGPGQQAGGGAPDDADANNFFDLLGQKGSNNLNNAIISGKSTSTAGLSNAVSPNINGLSFSSSSSSSGGYNSLQNGQSENLLRGGQSDNLFRVQSDYLLRGQSDSLFRSGQSDNLFRSGQSDNLFRSGQSDNLLRGQSDKLFRSGQSDNLLRGQSDNLFRSGQSDNLLRSGQSDNLLRSGQSDYLFRGQSDNLLRGQSDNLLRSGQSDNLFRAQSDNLLRSGQSDNLLRGQSDNLLRGQSNNLLRGGQSDNLLRGGQSENLLIGQSKNLLRGQSESFFGGIQSENLLRNGHYDSDPASLSLQPLFNFNPSSSLHANSFFPGSSSSSSTVPEPLSFSPFHKPTSGGAPFSNLSFSDQQQQQQHQQRISNPPPFLDLPNVPSIGSGSLSSKVNQSSINAVGNSSNGSLFHSHYDRAGMVMPSSPPPLTKMTSYPTAQFGSLVAHNEVASSSGSNKGIDQDVVLGNEFPMVAWLRQYNMHMYRWAGNSTEWTEFAMHVPRALTSALFNDDSSPKAVVSELMRRSGCRIWMERERLGGHPEKFMVFHKGSDGKANHVAMLTALELLSGVMRHWILFYGQAYRIANRGTPLYESSGSVGSTASMASEIVSLTLSAEIISAVTLFVSGIARRDRPPLLRVSPIPGSGYLQRYLEVSKDVAALLSGQSGRKLKDLAVESGAKIQFRVSRVAERDGRPSILEVGGVQENVDRALYLLWDVLQMLGKDYTEVLQVFN